VITTFKIWRGKWLYLGWERYLDDVARRPPRIQQFWYLEDDSPYGIGNGWRMKVGKDLSLHIGIRSIPKAANSSHVAESLGRDLGIPPTDIARWGEGGVDEDLEENR
jgi:hypothetical protein